MVLVVKACFYDYLDQQMASCEQPFFSAGIHVEVAGDDMSLLNTEQFKK